MHTLMSNGAAIQASEVDIKLDIGFANDDLGFVNVDYTDMAGGFTSQADDFNLALTIPTRSWPLATAAMVPVLMGLTMIQTDLNSGSSDDYALYYLIL